MSHASKTQDGIHHVSYVNLNDVLQMITPELQWTEDDTEQVVRAAFPFFKWGNARVSLMPTDRVEAMLEKGIGESKCFGFGVYDVPDVIMHQQKFVHLFQSVVGRVWYVNVED